MNARGSCACKRIRNGNDVGSIRTTAPGLPRRDRVHRAVYIVRAVCCPLLQLQYRVIMIDVMNNDRERRVVMWSRLTLCARSQLQFVQRGCGIAFKSKYNNELKKRTEIDITRTQGRGSRISYIAFVQARVI